MSDRGDFNYEIYQNVLAWRGCEQLYLDKRTADVQFVFVASSSSSSSSSSDTKPIVEKVPAHKAILSASSQEFDALFYGPFKQDGEIGIDGTTPDAFREFLQFFYIRSVKITTANVAAVMDLAKRYAVADCLQACADFYRNTLTLDSICLGYELAIQFQHEMLQQFCEEKICENPTEVFESQSFLECKSNLLRSILQLNGFRCGETVIFDGCIEWAKHACIENQLDENDVQNIRKQFGDLFYEFRFAGMTTKEFYIRSRKYDGLFSQQEFQDIIGLIANADADRQSQSEIKFSQSARKWTKPEEPKTILCTRIDSTISAGMNRYVLPPIDCTAFSSNCALKLTKIHCSEIFSAGDPVLSIPFGIKIIEMTTASFGNYENVLYFRQMSLNPTISTVIELATPIFIQANKKYGIVLQFQWWNSTCFNLLVHKPMVEINDDISIVFYNIENDHGHDYRRFGLITQLEFVTMTEQ